MRKKNKLRLSILFTLFFIIIFITVLIFFVLPKFDFMYISADKHWQKEKIGDVDEKTGGTEKEKEAVTTEAQATGGHMNIALYWFGETLDPALDWDGWTYTLYIKTN